MFEELLQHITTDEGKVALEAAKTKFGALKSEVEEMDKKLVDMSQSRDKYKNFTKTIKSKLGFEEGEELSEDTINDKLYGLTKKVSSKASEVEDALKGDVSNLEAKIKELNERYESTLLSKDSEISKMRFEHRTSKLLDGIKFQDADAKEYAMSRLMKGAEFDSSIGDYVFKNENGVVERKDDGTLVTMEDRVVGVEEKFSYLIPASQNSGSGTQQAESGGESMSEFKKIALGLV